MKLEQMFPNFLNLSQEEKIAFVATYRKRRDQDLNQQPTVQPKQVRSKIDVSPEEREILKMLGISVSDVKALRDQQDFGLEEKEDDSALFEDSTFSERGEEEV